MILRRNVLIFHLGALGDFVLTWPLAMALARLYPQSRVLYVTHGQKGKLAEKVLGVETSDIEIGWHHLFDDQPKLPPPALKLITGAHSIFTFVPGQNLDLAPEAAVTVLRAATEGSFVGHASDDLLEQLRPVATVHTATQQILRSIAAKGVGRREAAVADIVIHPGSGSVEKCWPVQLFGELIQKLRGAGRSVRVVLGEVELERWQAGEIERLESLAPVVRPQTYLDLHRELTSARLVIANDSGPGHLAGICGVPTLSLFGPTDPAQWKPLGPHMQVLRRQPMGDLAVDEVFAAAIAISE